MIPRVFHRYWTGPAMPDHLAAYGDTWRAHHPDWELLLWTDDTIPPLANQALYDQADTIAPAQVGQFRADVVRYELLHSFGGVWIDADLECLRPIGPLIAGTECFAGWERQDVWVGNTILGATPGHPFMAALIGGLPVNVAARRGARPCQLSGPQYVTPTYRIHPDGVTVFDQEHFYAGGWDQLDRRPDEFPDAYAWHWWGNQRCKKHQPGWDYAR